MGRQRGCFGWCAYFGWHACFGQHPGTVGRRTGNHTDPSALIAGNWKTWESQPFNLKKEAGSQVIRLSGSHPHKNKQAKKQQLETFGVESFTASTAESRMVHLGEGGASGITEALHPYRGSPPLLRQPAIAEATRHNRESPSLQRRATIAEAVLTTPI